jgi:hypothetical protein
MEKKRTEHVANMEEEISASKLFVGKLMFIDDV